MRHSKLVVDAREKILIVEDEKSLSTTLVRATETYFAAVCAASKAAAIDLVDAGEQVVAAIVDVGLPDGDGLDVVAALRKRSADMPILVLTGSNEPSTINRAHALRAEYVVKPFFKENLQRFVQRALAHHSAVDKDALQAQVTQITSECRLSAREAQILILAVEGVPRRRMSEVLDVSENTVKTQVRSLLDKLGKETLSDAVWWVRSAVEGKN
jgi:DNA-binding NarL/FixJ family response regulator